MRNLSRLILIAACGAGTALAGGEATERKEFKQSQTYPYVFRPVCYLATSGPVPLRFSVGAPDCGDRRGPLLTSAARHTPKPEPPVLTATPIPGIPVEPAPAPAPVATTTTTASTQPPAFPPPANAPAPKPPTVDFSQFPAELVEAFKKGRESADARNYLFDPIFLPAVPDDLPRSKATLKEK